MRPLPVSATYSSVPALFTATANGLFSVVVTMEVMSPVRLSTRRTRLLPVSAIKSVPSALTATPRGELTSAEAAAPPSPEKPLMPLLDTTGSKV